MVGGCSDYFCNKGTTQTELINGFNKHVCNPPPPFPSQQGRYGMVGVYTGGGSTLFCGGSEIGVPREETVKDDCYRYFLYSLIHIIGTKTF